MEDQGGIPDVAAPAVPAPVKRKRGRPFKIANDAIPGLASPLAPPSIQTNGPAPGPTQAGPSSSEEPPVKRKRGRPPKAKLSADDNMHGGDASGEGAAPASGNAADREGGRKAGKKMTWVVAAPQEAMPSPRPATSAPRARGRPRKVPMSTLLGLGGAEGAGPPTLSLSAPASSAPVVKRRPGRPPKVKPPAGPPDGAAAGGGGGEEPIGGGGGAAGASVAAAAAFPGDGEEEGIAASDAEVEDDSPGGGGEGGGGGGGAGGEGGRPPPHGRPSKEEEAALSAMLALNFTEGGGGGGGEGAPGEEEEARRSPVAAAAAEGGPSFPPGPPPAAAAAPAKRKRGRPFKVRRPPPAPASLPPPVVTTGPPSLVAPAASAHPAASAFPPGMLPVVQTLPISGPAAGSESAAAAAGEEEEEVALPAVLQKAAAATAAAVGRRKSERDRVPAKGKRAASPSALKSQNGGGGRSGGSLSVRFEVGGQEAEEEVAAPPPSSSGAAPPGTSTPLAQPTPPHPLGPLLPGAGTPSAPPAPMTSPRPVTQLLIGLITAAATAGDLREDSLPPPSSARRGRGASGQEGDEEGVEERRALQLRERYRVQTRRALSRLGEELKNATGDGKRWRIASLRVYCRPPPHPVAPTTLCNMWGAITLEVDSYLEEASGHTSSASASLGPQVAVAVDAVTVSSFPGAPLGEGGAEPLIGVEAVAQLI